MRVVFCQVGIALLLSVGAGAQSSPTKADLEAFERFVEAPGTQILWSQEVGRINTDEAEAVVSTLEAEDTAVDAKSMRGIRIDLISGDTKERVYTSAAHLERLIRAGQEVAPYTGVGRGCRGSGQFLLEVRQNVHAFSASECDFGDWSGLAVFPGDVRFTNVTAHRFAEIFIVARAELMDRTP